MRRPESPSPGLRLPTPRIAPGDESIDWQKSLARFAGRQVLAERQHIDFDAAQ